MTARRRTSPAARLERAILDDIVALDGEHDRYVYGTGGDPSDIDAIAVRLDALRARGEHDAVVRLGTELWSRASARIECSDEDWEGVLQSLQDAFDTVLAALPVSSLTPSEQLLWVLERLADDEYTVLARADNLLKRRAYGRIPWREAATALEQRLSALSKGGDFSRRYARSRVFEQLVRAYAKAGWKERVIPAMEAEVDASDQHVPLVDALLAAGDTEWARRRCIESHELTITHSPGTAATLRERLRELAASEGDHALVAAYRAQDFLDRPGLGHWHALEEAAEKVTCWPSVRQVALDYLETGRAPVAGHADWPLPPPEVELPPQGKSGTRFPDLAVLIDLALHEGRADDALAHHARLDPGSFRARTLGKRIAPAVADSHPDATLAIWRCEVDQLIAEVKPSAYERAGVLLRQMREVLAAQGRGAEWQSLIEALRVRHKAKRRLLGVLDALSR